MDEHQKYIRIFAYCKLHPCMSFCPLSLAVEVGYFSSSNWQWIRNNASMHIKCTWLCKLVCISECAQDAVTISFNCYCLLTLRCLDNLKVSYIIVMELMTMQSAEKTKRIQFHCTILVLLSIFDIAVYSVNFKWIKLYWGKWLGSKQVHSFITVIHQLSHTSYMFTVKQR